jgi:endogenous inhibitor of DNA gyrase (YacG/DUF329 family)
MADAIKCPTCRKEFVDRPETFPFCSERCRNVDLGHWFEGNYVVSRPAGLDESDFELPEAAPIPEAPVPESDESEDESV